MNTLTATTAVRVLQLDRARIPPPLTDFKRWVVWRAGTTKQNGKFDKVPVDPRTGRNINGNDPANWMTFEAACAAYDRGACSGIGITLCADPVSHVDGQPLYLVALDFDNCVDRARDIEALWKKLGRPYAEASPSGKGLRMFAISRTVIKGGNAGDGREMYGAGRFMTVTGIGGRGTLTDSTQQLLKLEAEWFGAKVTKAASSPGMLDHLICISLPETQANIDRIKAQLAFVSADCSYETWIRVVWSLQSNGWASAKEMAREWSMTAPHRYDEQTFEDVWSRFDPSRGITSGTLDYHARLGGWQPEPTAPVAALENVEPARISSRLLTRADLQNLPPMRWIVRGVLPARGLGAIFGASGSGKTFLALDLACALASGAAQWFGAKSKHAPVAYVALEGEAGIKSRLCAWEKQHQQQILDALRVVLGNFTLLHEEESKVLAIEVLRDLGAGAVVFVDTLNQSAPGADENGSVDMGKVIKHAKMLADSIEGLVVLIHHAGKDASRGMRGHSLLFAAMDSVIEVTMAPGGRSWRLSKSKEGETGAPHGFDLVPHVVGTDEDGLEVRSCAVRPSLPGAMVPTTPTKPVAGKNQKLALQVISGGVAQSGQLTMDDAVAAVAAKLNCSTDKRRTRARETIDSLVSAGHLLLNDEGGIDPPPGSKAPESLRFPFSIEKTGKAATGPSRNGAETDFGGAAPPPYYPPHAAETAPNRGQAESVPRPARHDGAGIEA